MLQNERYRNKMYRIRVSLPDASKSGRTKGMKNQGSNSRLQIRILGIGIAAVLTAACVNKAQQSFTPPPPPVSVAQAVAQDVPTYIDAVGKTVARETVSIQPQVSGRILQLHFTDGANVKKGDLLFTIDTRPFEATLKQAQANLSRDQALKKQAEANLAKEKAQANWGLTQVNRYRDLVEHGVVPREQYEELRANLDSLNANVEAARAAVHSADEAIKVDSAAIESAKVNLSYCFIRSPIDGRAGQRLVDVGNVVNPGGSGNQNSNNGAPPSNTLLIIDRIDPIYADFTISQNELTRVQQQMREGSLKVEVRLPDSTELPVGGQLTFLDNAIQTSTGTLNLRATIPNNGHLFWPGRFVNIRLILGNIPNAVLVPAVAPQMSATGLYVLVIKPDGTAERRSVTVGQRQGDLVVIEKGVNAGEQVVTAGQLGVMNAQKVRIEQPAATTGSK